MKIGFVIPVLTDCDIEGRYAAIESACIDCEAEFEVIFAFSGKLNSTFSKVRSTFIENKKVKAFKVDRNVNEHKLITIAMQHCKKYDATIIYSAKENVNSDVVKAFITSWKAGNKLVYLKKVYSHPKKLWVSLKRWIYSIGIKIMGLFKDFNAETDIQLLDQDVVKTINQLPEKNRHLRTLDSFIGYNYDIIKMEVDAKMKDNSRQYVEKTKGYKISSLICSIFAIFSITALVFGILIPVLGWKVRIFWQIVLWLAWLVCVVFALVFYTRQQLALRVGKVVDIKELKDLERNIEKYNF